MTDVRNATINELCELVRWLSYSYGDNEPVFAGADGFGTPDGQAYPLASRLRELYREIVGEKEPTEGKHLQRCDECGQFSVVSDMVTT